jgi:hypothetical protein
MIFSISSSLDLLSNFITSKDSWKITIKNYAKILTKTKVIYFYILFLHCCFIVVTLGKLDADGGFITQVPSIINTKKKELMVRLPTVTHKGNTVRLHLWKPIDLEGGRVRLIPTKDAEKTLQIFGDKIKPSILFLIAKLGHRTGMFNPELTGIDKHGIFVQIPPAMFAWLEILLCIEFMKYNARVQGKGFIYY